MPTSKIPGVDENTSEITRVGIDEAQAPTGEIPPVEDDALTSVNAPIEIDEAEPQRPVPVGLTTEILAFGAVIDDETSAQTWIRLGDGSWFGDDSGIPGGDAIKSLLSKAPKAVWIGAGSALVVLITAAALVFGVFIPQNQAHDLAVAAYNTAVQAYSSAQGDLSSTTTTASQLLASITVDDVQDPLAIDELTAQIATAQSLIAPAEPMASKTNDINQQADRLGSLTTAAKSTVTILQKAIDSVQQSRVDKSIVTLTAAITAAQHTYDSSGWTNDKADLAALQAQLDAANQAVASPSALGSDYETIIAAIGQLVDELQMAAATVDAAVAKATNATYSYVLYFDYKGADNQIVCGVNVCPDNYLASAKVIVKGNAVTVELCSTQQFVSNLDTCDGAFGRYTQFDWHGTRNGVKALVSDGRGAMTYLWGIVTFQGSLPNDPAIMFETGDQCQRLNGSYGQVSAYGYGCD